MALSMTAPAGADAFLAKAGWHGADLQPLAGDASFRRYFRVIGEDKQAVLMDAPPPEDPRPFIAVDAHLRGLGLAAPDVLATDLDAGLVLLEDFGDDRMREAIEADPGREDGIYADAIDLLVRLHRHPAAELPPYGRDELLREATLLVDWFAPAIGRQVDTAGYAAAWDAALAPLYAADARGVTVLRDYHAENIMLLPGRTGVERLGLLDFQDALAGHPAYDLVSLLQDARREVSAAVEAAMRDRYARATGAGADFDAAYALLGAQRNAKIVGIFTRLWRRDGKPRYLDYLPRVWSYLERDLAHPALAPVAAWFDANLPPGTRAEAALGR